MTDKIEPAWRDHVPVDGVYQYVAPVSGKLVTAHICASMRTNPDVRYYGPIEIPEPPPDLAEMTFHDVIQKLFDLGKREAGQLFLKQVIEAYGGKVPE